MAFLVQLFCSSKCCTCMLKRVKFIRFDSCYDPLHSNSRSYSSDDMTSLRIEHTTISGASSAIAFFALLPTIILLTLIKEFIPSRMQCNCSPFDCLKVPYCFTENNRRSFVQTHYKCSFKFHFVERMQICVYATLVASLMQINESVCNLKRIYATIV